jgi:precorrin-3B synthase
VPGLIKNACPGVHRPMVSADGLVARIRIPDGRLSLDQWEGVARAAAAHGSGIIELTSRANIQLRGVVEAAVPALTHDLVAVGVTDADGDADGRRNVVGAPATGLDPTEVVDVSALVTEIEHRLVTASAAIHPKAGVLVDAGGVVSVRGRRADVVLGAVRRLDTDEVAVEVLVGSVLPIDTAPDRPVAVVRLDDAAQWAVEAMTSSGGGRVTESDLASMPGIEWIAGGLLDRSTPDTRPPLGVRAQGNGRWVAGAAPLLGRLDPDLARAIAATARHHGAAELRLTPWRGFLVGDLVTDHLLGELGRLGLVIDGGDPASGVIACAGRAGCASGTTDTIADGLAAVTFLRRRATDEPAPTIHLSGCAKRCASQGAHDLTLVGNDESDRYDTYDELEAPIARSVTAAEALNRVTT